MNRLLFSFFDALDGANRYAVRAALLIFALIAGIGIYHIWRALADR